MQPAYAGAPPVAPPVPPRAPAAARPEVAVRLPLQIGTSSIWSLARCAATLLPSLGLMGGGVAFLHWAGIDKLQLGVAAALVVTGGMLGWFAVMHLRLAIVGRPSDVVLTAAGFRIEGGPHGGRTLRWSDIAPDATHVEEATEKRFTFFRILGNAFAVMLAVVVRDKVFWLEAHEFQIRRLYVGLRDGTKILIAEAERPIEKESLDALYEALVSSGWYGGGAAPAPRLPGKKKHRHTDMGISVLLCHHCGGVAPPEDRDVIPCRYCAHPVQVPPATRQRVAAAQALARSRKVSDKLVGKLIHQPGAGRIGILFLLASLPMMMAWPIAFVAIALEAQAGVLQPVGVISLLVFPLALILGLFFLLRAQISDRFALRLLTLDFGAQSPAKEGDPYTCRVCDAPLADEPGRVVVSCVYCNSDNILGLDLRRDADRASREATSLEDALKKRGSERLLWGALTVVAVGLVGLGGFFLKEGLDPMARSAQAKPKGGAVKSAPSAAPTATARPQKRQRRARDR